MESLAEVHLRAKEEEHEGEKKFYNGRKKNQKNTLLVLLCPSCGNRAVAGGEQT